MRAYCDKYGSSTWNAGRPKVDQSGVPEGYKLCSKIVDPRCLTEEGIHPLSGYRKHRPSRLTPYTAYCRFCESFMALARQRRPERKADFEAYQKQYSKEKWERMRLTKGFQIIYDPSGTYRRDNLFGRRDFKQTLKAGIWPEHLIVRDLKTRQCYEVHCMDLIEVEDRDWFVYRKEQVSDD